jgi:hypothetical protein
MNVLLSSELLLLRIWGLVSGDSTFRKDMLLPTGVETDVRICIIRFTVAKFIYIYIVLDQTELSCRFSSSRRGSPESDIYSGKRNVFRRYRKFFLLTLYTTFCIRLTPSTLKPVEISVYSRGQFWCTVPYCRRTPTLVCISYKYWLFTCFQEEFSIIFCVCRSVSKGEPDSDSLSTNTLHFSTYWVCNFQRKSGETLNVAELQIMISY